jgi:hypothetical protein
MITPPTGGHRGNTEGVVAQWQHPVASRVALDKLHWLMNTAYHQRICKAIEMGRNGGRFDCH